MHYISFGHHLRKQKPVDTEMTRGAPSVTSISKSILLSCLVGKKRNLLGYRRLGQPQAFPLSNAWAHSSGLRFLKYVSATNPSCQYGLKSKHTAVLLIDSRLRPGTHPSLLKSETAAWPWLTRVTPNSYRYLCTLPCLPLHAVFWLFCHEMIRTCSAIGAAYSSLVKYSFVIPQT